MARTSECFKCSLWLNENKVRTVYSPADLPGLGVLLLLHMRIYIIRSYVFMVYMFQNFRGMYKHIFPLAYFGAMDGGAPLLQLCAFAAKSLLMILGTKGNVDQLFSALT